MLRRVLLIDDDEADALTVQRVLNGGYDCRWRASLVDALPELAAASWDLILTDLIGVGVPIGDGARLVEALHRAAPSAPVVVLTGHTLSPAEQVDLLRAGAGAIIQKGSATLAGEVLAAYHRGQVRAAEIAAAEQAGRSADQVETRAALGALRVEVSGQGQTLKEILVVLKNPPAPWWVRGIGAGARKGAEWWGSLSVRARAGLLGILTGLTGGSAALGGAARRGDTAALLLWLLQHVLGVEVELAGQPSEPPAVVRREDAEP